MYRIKVNLRNSSGRSPMQGDVRLLKCPTSVPFMPYHHEATSHILIACVYASLP